MNARICRIIFLLACVWGASFSACGANSRYASGATFADPLPNPPPDLPGEGTEGNSPATVSLPLGGVYRAGKYMPVQIASDAEHGEISLVATGAMRTSATVLPSTRVIAPWLMLSETIQEPAWTDPASQRHDLPAPLHPLADNDRLVALVAADAKLAQSIFPDAHIVPIALEAGWNPEPAAAWEALDAIVVSEQNFPAMLQSVDSLLSAGTTIAVVAASAPSIHHDDWIQSGPLWLLHRQPLISHNPINPEAYGPTYDWVRGRSVIDRARILLFAIILSIAVVSIALWRSRWAVWAIVAVCIGGGAVVLAYDRQRPKMLQLRLGVASPPRLDAWTWYSPITAGDERHPFSNLSKPIFGSRRQARDLDITLNWSSNPSQRAFSFHLEHNQSLAFVDVAQSPTIDNVKPELLPDAKAFAEHLYIGTGDHLAGTALISQNGQLTTVVIDRQEKK